MSTTGAGPDSSIRRSGWQRNPRPKVQDIMPMCRETGEFPLKKFAEMVGTIQHLDDNTTAYIADNGTVIKSKDGKELEIDTSSMTYDMIMNMFKNLPKSGNYFDSSYWQKNIQKAMFSVEQ